MGYYKTSNFETNTWEKNPKIVIVKKCTCAVQKDACPFHLSANKISKSFQNLILPDNNSELSVQFSNVKLIDSYTSVESAVSTFCLSYSDKSDEQKQTAFKKWLAGKRKAKKRELKEAQLVKDCILQHHEERESVQKYHFVKWLNTKKKEEEKKQKHLIVDKEKIEQKRLEEEKKEIERKLKYNIWLKIKEQEFYEKQLAKYKNKLNTEKEREMRKAMNQVTYNEWLKSSPHKSKPIPFNRGLDSLRSSKSVNFINPNPWIPNIETHESLDFL